MPHQCTECGFTFPDGSKEMLSGCPDCGGNKFQYHPGAVPDDPEEGTDESPPERPDTGVSGAVGRAADTVRDVFGTDDSEDASRSRNTTGAEPAARQPDGREPDSAHGEPTGADDGAGADDPDGSPEGEYDDAPERTYDDPTEVDYDDPERGPPDVDAPPWERDAPETEGGNNGREDRAQADARSQVVDEADLPDPENAPDSPSRSGNSEASAESASPAEAGANSSGSSGTEGVGKGPSEPVSGDAPDETTDDQPELSDLREELNSQFESIRIVEPGQYELNLMELYDRDQYIIALQEDGRYVIEVPEAWRDE